MSIYTPIAKRYPKAKPLALALITAAAEQGASIEELRYACEFAIDACEKGRNASVPTISLFSCEAKQEKIMSTLGELLPKMTDVEQEKLLSFGEGMAFMMREREAERPGA